MYLDNFFTSVPVVVHCSFAHLRLILCELMDYSTSGFTVLLHLPAAAAKSLQSCLTLWDPIDGSPPGSPSLRFSRQEHWSGLPFPSPLHESEKWKWSRLVVSDPQQPHGLQPSRLLCPWDFPGKSTGVGCLYLPELATMHLQWVGVAIQPFCPLSSPSPPVCYLSQHQCLFQWVNSLHQVAKVLELQLHNQSFW